MRGFPLTEDNCDTALDLLKQRFGKSFVHKWMRLLNCSSVQIIVMHSLYDQVTVRIRGLEAYETTADQYGILLIPIVITKLPEEIRAREIEGEVWNMNDLMKVVLS